MFCHCMQVVYSWSHLSRDHNQHTLQLLDLQTVRRLCIRDSVNFNQNYTHLLTVSQSCSQQLIPHSFDNYEDASNSWFIKTITCLAHYFFSFFLVSVGQPCRMFSTHEALTDVINCNDYEDSGTDSDFTD